MKTQQRSTDHGVAVVGEFSPLAALWDGGGSRPLFLSESSARWFLRANRSALVEAKAIAIHAGRMLVHPARFAEVAERIAVQSAAKRAA
jgi:hypothetical protein